MTTCGENGPNRLDNQLKSNFKRTTLVVSYQAKLASRPRWSTLPFPHVNKVQAKNKRGNYSSNTLGLCATTPAYRS